MRVDASAPQALHLSEARAASAPTLGLMHASHLLAGYGTLLLGPILPLLSHHWQLTDSRTGLLPLAQFCGATLGGVTVPARLASGLLVGMTAGAAGFFAFAFAPDLAWALPALLVGGFGVGRCIASINIIGGARYTDKRGAALSRLNFSWSLGALLSPLLAAWLAPHLALRTMLCGFASMFLVCVLKLGFEIWRAPKEHLAVTMLQDSTAAIGEALHFRFFLYFAALLFVYGGLETSLNVWLTTYALRYGQSSLVLSEYTMVLLLCGLTTGRALASWLLLTMREAVLQRLALGLAAAGAAVLAVTHRASLIALLAVLLGVALAPIFPATFALLMARRPPARTAGIVLAASGLGAAALPWLMGVISTHSGSLQVALALPVGAAVTMLLLSTLPLGADQISEAPHGV
jgi:fucose permease